MAETGQWFRTAGPMVVCCGLLLLPGCTTGWLAPAPEPFTYDSVRASAPSKDYEQVRQQWEQKARHGMARASKDSSPGLLADRVGGWFGRGANPDEARQQFAAGEQLYRQAVELPVEERAVVFAQAAKHFVAAAKAWPDSALEQDALFFAGEAYFFADRYVQANDQFGKLLKKHPNCRYLDMVQARRFAIAQYWLAAADYYRDSFWTINLWDRQRPWRDTRGHALKTFDRIRIDDPTGKLADDATLAAANAYFRAGKYVMADQYYSDLRKTFPTSEHQFVAHFLGIQAKLRSYEGPDYSGQPLEEAEQLLKQVRRQFPVEYRKYRDDLEKMYAEVRTKLAERDWAMAQYYEKQQAYGGARFYYELVANDYPDTPYAQAARERITQIADLPPRPPQKLQWLVNQFPSNQQDRPLVATGAPPSVKR